MKNNFEECWLKDEPFRDAKRAPLLCLKCERLKTTKFMRNPESRETEIFLNGFRLALLELVIQLNEYAPLSGEQKEYIKCLEIQTKCSLDRGIPVEKLEECIKEMMKQAELFRYK